MSMWEVVGGADKGGILVRRGQDITSDKYPQRLSTGALLEEVKLAGDRLGYKLLTGTGPREGWVSISLPGKELVVRTSKRPPQAEARKEAERPAPRSAPRPAERPAPQPAPKVQEPPKAPPQPERQAPQRPAPPEEDPYARRGAEAPPRVEAEAPPAADEPLDLGAFGDSGQRSAFRMRPMPPLEGIPSGGLVGTIAWDVPMGQLHDALCEALGVTRGAVSVGWRGRDLEDGATLMSSGIIGTSKGAKQRALEQTVELVFMLDRGTVVRLKAPAGAAAGAAAAGSGSPAAAAVSSSGSGYPVAAVQPAAAKPAPSAAELRYASQLEQLAGMGFTDKDMLLPTLEAKRGNVQAVVDFLLS